MSLLPTVRRSVRWGPLEQFAGSAVRAFIGQFDSVSRGVFGLGLAIGAVWLGRRRERLEARRARRRSTWSGES
jgi:hypothetical protein